MDARLFRILPAVIVFSATLADSHTQAATFRTANFVVEAPSQSIATQVGRTAERYRKLLALEWLGKEMRQWYRPCRVRVSVGQIGAGGATTFSFDHGHVFGWDMRVQGTLERILDSVIPHEVSHTIFACHFRRPLPRWADEGAATLVEHESEQRVQQLRLKQVINTARRIPLRRLLSMKQYPRDMQQVLVLYAEGYSLADFLVQKAGKAAFLKFLDSAHRNGWDRAISQYYRFKNVETLERRWMNWVSKGSPPLSQPRDEQFASRSGGRKKSDTVIRSQSPDSASRRFVNPSIADAKGQTRGLALVAPDPKRGSRIHETAGFPTTTSDSHWNRSAAGRGAATGLHRPTAGRRKTLNAGWIPVIRKPRPRKNPSRRGVIRTSLNQSRRPRFSSGSSDRTLDETARFRRVEAELLSADQRRMKADREERAHPRGLIPRWSRFPQHRTAGGQPDIFSIALNPPSPERE